MLYILLHVTGKFKHSCYIVWNDHLPIWFKLKGYQIPFFKLLNDISFKKSSKIKVYCMWHSNSFLQLSKRSLIASCALETGHRLPFGSLSRLKVVTSEKIGGSGVTSTLGTWYGGVVMGVLFSFNEAAILYRDFNSAPSQKQNIIVFAANNSRCCKCDVAPTIIL